MKNKLIIAGLFFGCINPAFGGELTHEVEGNITALYGFSDVSEKFEKNNQNNQMPFYGNINFSSRYDFNDDYALSLNLGLSGATDKEVKNYNQGDWGEEVYAIFDSPFGRLMGGQTYNAAYQLLVSAPAVAPIKVNNSDITDFIANPNWSNRNKNGLFQTLNSTDINTDGLAPKISYISPEFYGSYVGFSYVPDSYDNAGLINRRADYKNNSGYIAALYHENEIGGFEVASSLALARYENISEEYALGLNISRGNWTLGGGFRQSNVGSSDILLSKTDGFREGYAYNIGLSYEFGPFKSALSYFEAKAKDKRNQDEIIQLANRYQFNKNLDFYFIAAHVNYRGESKKAEENNKGFALVSGLSVNF